MADTWALKEWAIAVDALLAGQLILLVRKGGIRERQPYFEVPSDRALLFPTHEHQRSEFLRSPYDLELTPESIPQVGDTVGIHGWGQITHRIPLPSSLEASFLRPFHIWTDGWLSERLAWKPERPAYALLLRGHRFTSPMMLTYQTRYGGCRSWITVDAPDRLPESYPVLSDAAYEKLSHDIQTAITAAQPSVDNSPPLGSGY